MGSPQAEDINREIIRAWRDPDFAATLSPETRDAMPAAPADIDGLTDDQLMGLLADTGRESLNDDQLAVAAGAGTNGVNENSLITRVQSQDGLSVSQAQYIAQQSGGLDINGVSNAPG